MLGVYDHLILPFGERLPLIVGQAEAPTRRVVARYIRDSTGLLGQAVEVRVKLGAGEFAVKRDGVVEQVQGVVPDV